MSTLRRSSPITISSTITGDRRPLIEEQIEQMLLSTDDTFSEEQQQQQQQEQLQEEEEQEEDDDDLLTVSTESRKTPSNNLEGEALREDFATMNDLRVTSDVDSVLVLMMSLEPLKCALYDKILTKPPKVMMCLNTKVTKYLEKRQQFGRVQDPMFRASHEDVTGGDTWYEFAEIDFIKIHLVFQLAHDSALFDQVPIESTKIADGRLRVVCQAFVRHVLVQAAQYLSVDCESSANGIKFAANNIDDTYTVAQQDFEMYAKYVTAALKRTNLREECGMGIALFYIATHGMRVDKNLARTFLNNIVSCDHAHTDILQIHRADTLWCENHNPVLTTLTGPCNVDETLFQESTVDVLSR